MTTVTQAHIEKLYHISHSKGSIFLPLRDPVDGTVPKLPIDRDGQDERFVTELRPGDTIYVKGSGIPETSADFSEIKGILRRKRADYNEDRAELFIELGFLDDQSVYETTRLSYDLYHAVAQQRPDLFRREEIENLDKYIFRGLRHDRPDELTAEQVEQWRYNFSPQTVSNVFRYIAETARDAFAQEGIRWRYGDGAIKSWLRGVIIHPTHGTRRLNDLVDAMFIGNALNSNELEERATNIVAAAERAQQYPRAKDENAYFRLIDGHKTVSFIVRGLMGGTPSRSRRYGNGTIDESNIRIHENLPDWTKAVLEELAPRVEHGVVEAQVYSTDVVEVNRDTTPTDQAPKGEGLSRNVILVGSDETQREEVYRSIGAREKPARRVNRLQRDLEGSIELLRDIYEAAVPFYVSSISLTGNAARIMPDVPIGIASFNKLNEIRPCINLDQLRFLSPVENYSSRTMVQTYEQWDKLLLTASRERNFRRDLIKRYRQGNVDIYALFDRFMPIFEESPLLREMFTEKQFLRVISTGSRYADIRVLEALPNTNPRTIEQAYGVINAKLLSFLIGIENAVAGKIEELKELDQNIPQDLTMFRTIERAMAPSFRTYEDNYVRERQLFEQLLQRYGINPHRIIALYDNTVSIVSDLTVKRISDGSKGKIINFAIIDPLTGKQIVTQL